MDNRKLFDITTTPNYSFDDTAELLNLPVQCRYDDAVQEYILTFNILKQVKHDYGMSEGAKYPLEKVPYQTEEEQKHAAQFIKNLFTYDRLLESFITEHELALLTRPDENQTEIRQLTKLMQDHITVLLQILQDPDVANINLEDLYLEVNRNLSKPT